MLNVICELGDVDPILYGGAFVTQDEDGDKIWWFRGLDSAEGPLEGEELDHIFTVSAHDLPADVRREFDNIEWREIETWAGHTFSGTGVLERASAFMALVEYWGNQLLDPWEMRMTGHQICEKFGLL